MNCIKQEKLCLNTAMKIFNPVGYSPLRICSYQQATLIGDVNYLVANCYVALTRFVAGRFLAELFNAQKAPKFQDKLRCPIAFQTRTAIVPKRMVHKVMGQWLHGLYLLVVCTGFFGNEQCYYGQAVIGLESFLVAAGAFRSLKRVFVCEPRCWLPGSACHVKRKF